MGKYNKKIDDIFFAEAEDERDESTARRQAMNGDIDDFHARGAAVKLVADGMFRRRVTHKSFRSQSRAEIEKTAGYVPTIDQLVALPRLKKWRRE